MKKILPILLLGLVAVVGCASYAKTNQMTKFTTISENYEAAIRWFDFDAADSFRKDSINRSNPLDFKHLKRIEVISYEVKKIVPIEDEEQIIRVGQVVEIKYYKIDDLVIKTIVDNQSWEYDQESENWYLTSEFPEFK